MELREYRPEDCEAITRLFYDTVHTVNRWDYAPAHVHQQILHGGHIGGLAAHAGKGTALAAGGFLALITKHFLFHGQISLWMGNEGNAGAFLVKNQPA